MSAAKDVILYIDDEQINLDLFRVSFEDDYNVLTTLSTVEARELLAQNNVKVVLSDLRMPHESGTDFIKNVSPVYPDIFYVILTAYLDVDEALKAINQGNTFRYLLKPWDANQIRDTISSAIYSFDLKAENRKLVAQLKEREKQFYNIFYFSSDGIIIFNRSGHILLANPAFMNIMGLSGDEDLNVGKVFRSEPLKAFNTQLSDIFDKPLPTSEYHFEVAEGLEKYIEINSSLIDYNGQQVSLSLIRDITEWRLGSHKTFNAVIQAEERERNRIASDLHDGIGPMLSAIKMYIEWLSDKSRNGSHEEILQLATTNIAEAILQVRTLSHNLSPHVLEKFGLVPGLQSHIDLLKKSTQIEFNINSNLKNRLKPAIELTLYRALKECINNTIKHAVAKNVFIVISLEGKRLSVIYSDNGSGFDVEQTIVETKGIGLYNIKNRIASLGGLVDIISAPGMGTRIKMDMKNIN